jgi:hypothetical protein
MHEFYVDVFKDIEGNCVTVPNENFFQIIVKYYFDRSNKDGGITREIAMKY